ncbi:hypothetical protein Q5H93_12245 [Hymenobacter sp. ASUV-10]|uniref:Uncharacterized protein n=1 Tax=Hymenobacter aranciens TaxID=3063996 RepID=A0ABT9BB58_9BACT|nr:hypothetical protein [Hymenobacter sp. ASUV-10]MDO7875505.1 hypothetical protein [Hymenobacter sp. ASUV-10]
MPASDNPDHSLQRIREVQTTIEQQLDEIQNTLTAMQQRQVHLDNNFQNLTAALKLVIKTLVVEPGA